MNKFIAYNSIFFCNQLLIKTVIWPLEWHQIFQTSNIMSSRLKRDWCLSYYDLGNILHKYISHLRYKLRNFISQSESALRPELYYWILKFPIDRSYGYWSSGGQFLWIFDQVVAAIRQERRPGQENVRRGCPGKTKHLKTTVI